MNGAGEFDRDVTDQHDFRLTVFDPGPDWALDAVVYQIFPDRFASTGPKDLPEWASAAQWSDPVIHRGARASTQLYGGDLDGIAARLDHIAGLGATTVYLTPIFPARSNHRYNATSFARVDPLLGGDAALARLAAAVHERGMRLIGDLTSNHSGDDHEWFLTARQDPRAPERGYYYLNDDGSYVDWMGFPSLPKLNMASEPLRDIMFGTGDSVVARWLRPPYELDGWRIDVANMTGRNGPHDDTAAVARLMRSTLDAVRPGSALIAEHCHDASGDLTGDGWQGTMNYTGFTRPVWSFLTSGDNGLDTFLGVPAPVPSRAGRQIVATMRDFAASVAWKVAARQWNLIASHDTPRFATVTADDAAGPGRRRAALHLPGDADGVRRRRDRAAGSRRRAFSNPVPVGPTGLVEPRDARRLPGSGSTAGRSSGPAPRRAALGALTWTTPSASCGRAPRSGCWWWPPAVHGRARRCRVISPPTSLRPCTGRPISAWIATGSRFPETGRVSGCGAWADPAGPKAGA